MSSPSGLLARAAIIGLAAVLLPGPAPPASAQPSVVYAYDAAGRLAEVRSPGQVLRFQYDAAGNLVSEAVEATPFIAEVSPAAVVAGSGDTVVTVDGLGFQPGSVVRWNGAPRATTHVSATRLTAVAPAADLAAPTAATVTVANPDPTPTLSNTFVVFVNGPGPAVSQGASVQAALATGAGPVSVTLEGVTREGTLSGGSVVPGTAPAGLALLPSGSFEFSADQVAFSTATLCVPYSDAEVQAVGGDEQLLVLLHREAGTTEGRDITTSRDPHANTVCGRTTTFSPFTLAAVLAGTGTNVRYLAEGATSAFFDMQIALANPDALAPANVTLRLLRADGSLSARYVLVPPMGRRTVRLKDVPLMAEAAFSTVVESDVPVVVDRTMSWNADGYGSHAEGSVGAPSPVWYLAEGATHSGFNLFYLVQNPNARDAQIEVTYLRPAPATPLVKTYAVSANSRFNIWVDVEEFPAGSGVAALSNTDVSAVIRATDDSLPVIVERAMYLDAGGQMFGAGHDAAGVTAASTRWFLAEGATGPYFDLYMLIANPGDVPAQVRATYLLPSGQTVTRDYSVAPRSRYTVFVDGEDAALGDTAVSTTVTSLNDVPVIVERAMWWPGSGFTAWQEAHASAGSVVTGETWALAEGEQGGPRAAETYVLIANASPTPAQVRVTIMFEDGAPPAVQVFDLPPTSRFNVVPPFHFAQQFGQGTWRRFGVLVESLGDPPAQIVVERAMYSNAQGRTWAAGTNATGTRIR